MRSKKWLNTIWVAQAANDAVSPGASRKTGSAVHGGFSVPPSSLLVRNSTTMSVSIYVLEWKELKSEQVLP
jgi:hypothetical protein